MKNSFKQLETEILEKHPVAPSVVEDNIRHNLKTVRTMGEVLDIYLTKAIHTFLICTGAPVPAGKEKEKP